MYSEFEGQPGPQYTATDISRTNIAIREYRKEYMERWNATQKVTGTGRPIDGIISPLAPSPSSEPLRYRYYSYTTWVNVIDYPSCVIPVTTADQNVDTPLTDFKPLSHIDEDIMKDCKSDPSLIPYPILFLARRWMKTSLTMGQTSQTSSIERL